MWQIIKIFFFTLGVLQFLLLIGVGTVWFSDAYGIKTATTAVVTLFTSAVPASTSTSPDTAVPPPPTTGVESDLPAAVLPAPTPSSHTDTTTAPNQNAAVTANQQAVLEAVGIPVETLPQTLTPAQLQCMNEKIGAARVTAITAGAVPTPLEVITAASCL